MGYEAKDCHFKEVPSAVEDSPPPVASDPSGGNMIQNSASRGERLRREVVCHREKTVRTQVCTDDNGVEHPLQWCKDRGGLVEPEDGKPTSALDPVHGAGRSVPYGLSGLVARIARAQARAGLRVDLYALTVTAESERRGVPP